MVSWIRTAASRLASTIAAVMLLALVALPMLPAAPASASAAGSVESWWASGGNDVQIECSLAPYYDIEAATPVIEVYNPCDYRVWVHYVSDSTPSANQNYCVNPGGGLAYDIPNFPFDSGAVTYSWIQLTTNPNACDSGADSEVWWYPNDDPLVNETPEPCSLGADLTIPTVVAQAYNACDSRMWLHGAGNASLCLNPGQTEGPFGTAYDQVEIVANQAPCGDDPAPDKY